MHGAIARGIADRGRGLGRPACSRGQSEDGGGDWDAQSDGEGNGGSGEGTETPRGTARALGGHWYTRGSRGDSEDRGGHYDACDDREGNGRSRERGDSDALGDHEGVRRMGRGLGHPGQLQGHLEDGDGFRTLGAIARGIAKSNVWHCFHWFIVHQLEMELSNAIHNEDLGQGMVSIFSCTCIDSEISSHGSHSASHLTNSAWITISRRITAPTSVSARYSHTVCLQLFNAASSS